MLAASLYLIIFVIMHRTSQGMFHSQFHGVPESNLSDKDSTVSTWSHVEHTQVKSDVDGGQRRFTLAGEIHSCVSVV